MEKSLRIKARMENGGLCKLPAVSLSQRHALHPSKQPLKLLRDFQLEPLHANLGRSHFSVLAVKGYGRLISLFEIAEGSFLIADVHFAFGRRMESLVFAQTVGQNNLVLVGSHGLDRALSFVRQDRG